MITSLLQQFIANYGYLALVPGSIFAQPAAALVAGVLAHLGYLTFWIAYVCIISTTITADAAWYYLGYHYGERFVKTFGTHIGVTDTHITDAKKLFHSQHDKILFISKITNGLGFAIVILFTAGMSRVPFIRYILFNICGELVWTGMLMLVGYFFSQWYVAVDNALGRMSIIALFVLLAIAFYGFARFMHARMRAKQHR